MVLAVRTATCNVDQGLLISQYAISDAVVASILFVGLASASWM